MIEGLHCKLSVRHLCHVLGLPRSSYYAQQQPRPKRQIALPLERKIRQLHKEHRGALGARGLSRALKAEGMVVGRHRMGRLIQELGLVRRRARYAHYRRATKPSNIAPNVLERRFDPSHPNTFWAGDITYIRVGGSWLYLAIVMDLFSRRVVGWAFSRTADVELSLRALRLAVSLRKPSAELVFHSDQGCQYTADRFVTYLAEKQIVQSMSRRGNCWDNAVVERYFKTQKHDWSPENGYSNHFEAERDVMDFIVHYNHRRCHSASNNLPPALYEQQVA
ncbi:MAG: transposase [Pseudomonas sp.]|nr:transposase [Pseudomonas sp.]